MKSYTDLEQSRKLAEILPLESADMMYSPPMLTHFKNYGDADNEQELPNYMVINVRRNIIESNEFDEPIPIRKGDFPCWSLAALLSVVPEEVSLNSFKDGKILWDTKTVAISSTLGVPDIFTY